jgi:hypothetical protein
MVLLYCRFLLPIFAHSQHQVFEYLRLCVSGGGGGGGDGDGDGGGGGVRTCELVWDVCFC